jgi:hypothetical protein
VQAHGEVRGTQSLVQVMAAVWRRPSWTALEVAWRWVLGVPALALLGWSGWRVWLQATGGTGNAARIGMGEFTLMDPLGAAEKLAGALGVLLPLVWNAAVWLLPLLAVGWVVMASLGRAAVMRRMDAALVAKKGTLLALNALRLLVLGLAVAVWFGLLTWAGRTAVSGPAERGAEPNLVGYFAMVVVGTLLLFVAWAAASWVFSVAPVLSMAHGWGVRRSLGAAVRLKELRSKLFEINLVMGIVKAALVVLAMVFSACPLPFQTYATAEFLWAWSAGVGVLYLLASDYFHVVRAAAYLALLRAMGER